MLNLTYNSSNTNPGWISFASQILESMVRRLAGVVFGISILLWVIAGMFGSGVFTFAYFGLLFATILITFLTLHLSSKSMPLSILVWEVGLAFLITGSLVVYPNSFFRLFYILLPFLAAITIGWYAGVLMEALVIGFVVLLSGHSLLPPLYSASTLEIIYGSAFFGAIGWTLFNSFLQPMLWYFELVEHAQKTLKEARDRQAELEQTREDLVKVNQQLALQMDRHKALQQVAEKARQAKAEFVANVSHELRAPLNMIIGFSDLITRSPRSYGSKINPKLMADITTIQRNARHLARLVDDVLDLSQIEAGRMALSREMASVESILLPALDAVGSLFETKGLILKHTISGNVPLLFCDPYRIRQVLINLLSNAGRFTERGGVDVTVTHTESQIVFCVKDTGPGISKENQARLFEPFQQADSSIRREHGGSGLGLSISKQFIEMHGGKIWIESETEKGTTISFSLPSEIPVELSADEKASFTRWFDEDTKWKLRTRPMRAPLPHIEKRYLLCEPGSTLLRWYKRYAEDIVVSKAISLEEAFQELEHVPAQALIVNTPQLLSPEGFRALVERFTDLPYDTPAISCWIPGREDVARELGVLDYLIKPVEIDTLQALVMKANRPVRTVLVVEDESDLRQLFAQILGSPPVSCQVLRAETGDEALHMMRARHPDLVFLDLYLPVKDGYKVLQEKKADEAIRDIPVIIVSNRDPIAEEDSTPIMLIHHRNGIPARKVMALVQAISEILLPPGGSAGPASLKTSPG